MKFETFFETFDQLADMPNAVVKMRELVTQLAVQGKLVKQGTEDEPADDLVSRVVVSLPKKQSENPFLNEISPDITSETPYDLPIGWTWLPLGHVGVWATGCGFPKQYQGETDGEFLFCKVSDMNLPGNEIEIRTTVNSIDSEVMKKVGARENPVGTVIFPKIGGAIATNKRRIVIKPTIIDNNCSGIQPIGLTDSKWLLILMRSIDLKKYQTGTSVPAVSQGALDPIRVGLPPLAEQKRIVAKVDELMALCDRLEAQQQERDTRHAALARASLARFAEAPTPANLDFLFHNAYTITPADLRKAILTLAVQGKLVPQDPNHELAEELYARIQSAKEQLIKTRTIKRVSVEPNPNEGSCDQLPTGWIWTRLGNVFDVRDGTHDTPKYTSEGFPLITSKNIYTESLSFEGANFISEEDHRQISERSRVDRRDILFAMIGSIGNPVIVDTDREFSIKNVALFKYYAPDDAEPRFLLLYLKLVSEEMRAKAAGGVQSFVSLGFLRNYPFPLPPLAEQHRIVAKVDQLMALVDQLETQLTASRATAAKLMEAVVAELTTQD